MHVSFRLCRVLLYIIILCLAVYIQLVSLIIFLSLPLLYPSLVFLLFLSYLCVFVVSTFPYMVPVTISTTSVAHGYMYMYILDAGTISWVNHMTVNESISLCQRSSVLRGSLLHRVYQIFYVKTLWACQCYPYIESQLTPI